MFIDDIEILDTRLYKDVLNGLKRDGHITISTPMLVGKIDDGNSLTLVFGRDNNKIIKRLLFNLIKNNYTQSSTSCSIISTDYATFELNEDDYCMVTLDIHMQEEDLKDGLALVNKLIKDTLEIITKFYNEEPHGKPCVYFDSRREYGATEYDVRHNYEKVVSACCYFYILLDKVSNTPCLYVKDGSGVIPRTPLPAESANIALSIRATNNPEPPSLCTEYVGGELNFM